MKDEFATAPSRVSSGGAMLGIPVGRCGTKAGAVAGCCLEVGAPNCTSRCNARLVNSMHFCTMPSDSSGSSE